MNELINKYRYCVKMTEEVQILCECGDKQDAGSVCDDKHGTDTV